MNIKSTEMGWEIVDSKNKMVTHPVEPLNMSALNLVRTSANYHQASFIKFIFFCTKNFSTGTEAGKNLP